MGLWLPGSLAAQPAPAADPRTHKSPPPSMVSAESGFRLTEPDGFRTRETFSRLEIPLGGAGPLFFKSGVHFAHMAVTDSGGAPPELYKSGAELAVESGKKTLKLGIDSNSDRLFRGPDTFNLDATYTFMLRERGGGSLLGGVNYSSQRSFARHIPLPFLVYRYQSRNFFMVFPFMYRFRLSDAASLSLTYAPLKNLRGSLRWQSSPDFYAEFEGGGELDQFLLAGRADKSMRFYYQRYTAAFRPSWRIKNRLRLACALGYFFKGYYYNGKTYNDYGDRHMIGKAPYFEFSLKYELGA